MTPTETLTLVAWNLCYALVILLFGSLIANWARGAMAAFLGRTRLDPIVRRLLVSVVRPLILAIAVFAALQKLGVPISTFAAMLGAATLAVGMAMRGSLSNVASGTMLLTLRPFNVGDTVTAGGHTGTVHALKLFTTELHTADGQTVCLPNDVLWKGAIVNFADRPTRRIRLLLTVPINTDLSKAIDTLTVVTAMDDRVLADPKPGVSVADITEVGLQLEVELELVDPVASLRRHDFEQHLHHLGRGRRHRCGPCRSRLRCGCRRRCRGNLRR